MTHVQETVQVNQHKKPACLACFLAHFFSCTSFLHQREHSSVLCKYIQNVVSKVDYCNSVLAGISGNLIRQLQSIMNAAARLVFLAKRSDHITPLLRELHWLKVPERIQFRLGMLAYRCLHNTAPAYLAESLQLARDVDARRRLRSAVSMTMVVPATRCSTLGDRAFPVSAARTWNALPSDVRAVLSLTTFRQKLKQSLFLQSFPDEWLATVCCTVPL